MRTISCMLGVAGCLIASRAQADVSKAWAAAKDNLPANTMFFVAIDVGAIYKSPLYAKALDAFKSMDRDIDEVYTLIKGACGWDPASVVDGIVIAGDPKSEGGIAFVQLTIDRTKASACLESALKAMKKGKNVTVKQDGAYTVAAKGSGDRDSAYFPWAGPNVVAISLRPDKKSVVDAWFGQKGFGKSLVSGMIGKLDGKATVAGAFASDKAIDSWVPVTKGYGNWSLGGGKITGAMVVTGVDAKAASSLADELNKEIKKDMGRDRTPASVKKIMGSISITVQGTDITFKGSTSEKDLGEALGEAFMKKKKYDDTTPDPDMAATLTQMEGFSKSMCACKDKACADKVNDSMSKWGTDMAKKQNPGKTQKPSADQIKHVTDVMTKYTDCMTKLMMATPPKKDSDRAEGQYKMKK